MSIFVQSRLADYSTGSKLPNGATVIAIKLTGTNRAIVLAARPGTYEPWVTWALDPRHAESTESGHYHQSIAAAAAEYEERT